MEIATAYIMGVAAVGLLCGSFFARWFALADKPGEGAATRNTRSERSVLAFAVRFKLLWLGTKLLSGDDFFGCAWFFSSCHFVRYQEIGVL